MSDDDVQPLPIDDMTQDEIEYQYDLFVENLSLKDFVRLARSEGWRFWVDREESQP